DRAELAAKGVTIKHALPGGRYLARVLETANLAGEARVVAITPLTAGRKIDRSALREVASGRMMASVNVIFHRDVVFEDAMQAVIAAGGLVEPFTFRYQPAQRIEAAIAPSALTALAEDERVFAITGPRNFKVTVNNANSAAVAHVTEVQAAPYGLTGEGVVVSLFELGEMQTTHVELAGRATTHPPGFCNPTGSGCVDDIRHATHVAGTIGAAAGRADAKGMAPKATIHEFPVSRSWLSLKEKQLALTGSRADNNSWGYTLGWESGALPLWNGGGAYYGAYDLIIGAPLDKISNEQGILFVHSAGNDGSSLPAFGEWKEHQHVDLNSPTFENLAGTFCVSKNGSGTDCPAGCTGVDAVSKEGPCEVAVHGAAIPFDTMGVTASAKNIIAVGALGGVGGIIASYSSRGPAKDGRVKPDIVARGSSVRSSVPTDSYALLSGTSMASPAVTGIAALLVEQWRRTFAGATPKPSHLKALLLAGADDIGNPGPDYTYGFGLVNAKRSVDLILADAGKGERIRDLTFAQGESQTQHEIPLVVTEQTNLRVVLNWPDPPIAMPVGSDDDIAEVALVNNLDLKVIDPSGNTVLPWVLDKTQVNANATRG
ncbi:MAG: S8 family serine peptidase, partial [Gemmatimonadota bacterium]